MKYYSEKLNKTFDTEKECLDAESAQEKAASAASKRKKELAKEIEEADKKLTEANKLYELAKDRAAEILEKSNKEVKDILDVATKQVKDAEEHKLNCVLKFNKEFGTYTTTYTGERALDEYNKSIRFINNAINSTFKDILKNFLF